MTTENFLPDKVRHVWIASFPRSGNTFFRVLCAKSLGIKTWSKYYTETTRYADVSSEYSGSDRLPEDWRERLSSDPSYPLAMIKTHDPPEDDAPAIYLLRNGMLSTDSFYHYLRDNDAPTPLIDVIAGATQFGSWDSHVRSWLAERNRPTLLIRFEDLVSEPEVWIGEVADFCGLDRSTIRYEHIPRFKELNSLNNQFFRSGRTSGLPDWDPEYLSAFSAIQGDTMNDYSYECEMASAVGRSVIKAVARTAERHAVESSHRLSVIGELSAKEPSSSMHPLNAPSAMQTLDRLVKDGLEVQCVYDLGASNARWSLTAIQYVPNAEFVLFEPQADLRKDYREGLDFFLSQFPAAKCHACAVGNVSGTIEIHSDPAGVGATTLEISHSGDWSQFIVPVKTLKEIIEEGGSVPTLVKIDTQGSELLILEGMGSYLEQVSVLFLKTWLVKSYEGKVPLLSEIVCWLAPRGFFLYEFGDAYRDPITGVLVAPDVVFLNIRCPLSPNHGLRDQIEPPLSPGFRWGGCGRDEKAISYQ